VASGCLDEGTVVAFLDGGLAEAERSVVEDHVSDCASCADLVTWAAADQAQRSRSVGRGAQPFIGQLAPGSRVDRYQILGAVGRGGMGEVYAAYHPDLDRRIALKVVNELGADSATRRARLLREARAIARLSHPNVVSVHDAGAFGDRVYIAMEFVEGETVDTWLRTKPRRWREILEVFTAAGRGLAAAHAAGIIHRDFKPQNVMIGRDGSVRVMDFGLARLAEEPTEAAGGDRGSIAKPQIPTTVTKTGALLGTLEYMAPEQFRGETLDVRADQFSFCVAFHEALFGSRPALAHVLTPPDREVAPPHAASAPAWLRAIVSRGLAAKREGRFGSMDELLRALVLGRTRPRRRALAASASFAALLVAFGGWHVARRSHISCTLPKDRLAATWSGHGDARRELIHRAFSASGRPTAEVSWQRVSKMLDDYIGQWSAMYIQACEATHVRGEQSAEVLDLRMSCLSDGLDQARAFANVLGGADGAAIGHAVAAVQDLTPVSRCADIALLRSDVPLPRDQKTLDSVRELRAALREAEALRDVANFRQAHERATALLPSIEKLGYKPLLAEALELIGCSSGERDDPAAIEQTLKQALFAAIAAHDDATAARAAADLAGYLGSSFNQPQQAETWFHLAESILDRLGPGSERTRAWADNNFAQVLAFMGQLERAERLARDALDLKERALGKEHADVAISLSILGAILDEAEHPAEALACLTRAVDVMIKNGDPDSDRLANTQSSKGFALIDLGRAAEAESSFWITLRILKQDSGPSERAMAFPLQGLGEARVLQGDNDSAIAFLEKALIIQETREPIQFNVAETRYWLARALWDSGRDRPRAIRLALEAKEELATHQSPRRERAVAEWLATHARDEVTPMRSGRTSAWPPRSRRAHRASR
jgi:serine/threonine protein kinase/tetratricopeptide (TPR) repeat protein